MIKERKLIQFEAKAYLITVESIIIMIECHGVIECCVCCGTPGATQMGIKLWHYRERVH